LKIQESGENYLETILMLEQKNGSVRSIDIANELEFSKPSVSRAMSILKSAGMIIMDKNNQILLTEAGRQKAEAVYERHCLLSHFLEQILGVSAETASADACRIEHVISTETFERIKDFIKQQKEHAAGGQQ
jgi:DtxR family Mn-dependent transcriptional regulator